MNAPVKSPDLTYDQAFRFLEDLVFEAVDYYHARKVWFDVLAIADYIEKHHAARIAAYVRARVDWASIATDEALVTADDALACYEDPPKFRALVDAALVRYFITRLEDLHDAVSVILERSHYIKRERMA